MPRTPGPVTPKKRRGPLLWLAARTRRFWVAVVVLAPVLYVVGLGPAIWLTAHKYVSESTASSIYRPVLWSAAESESASLESAVNWWGSLWLPYGKWVDLEINTNEFEDLFQFPFAPPDDYPKDEAGIL